MLTIIYRSYRKILTQNSYSQAAINQYKKNKKKKMYSGIPNSDIKSYLLQR